MANQTAARTRTGEMLVKVEWGEARCVVGAHLGGWEVASSAVVMECASSEPLTWWVKLASLLAEARNSLIGTGWC